MKTKLLILAIAAILCGGCRTKTAEIEQNEKRFQVIYLQDEGVKAYQVIIDKETNIKYLYVQTMYSAGLTKLEE